MKSKTFEDALKQLEEVVDKIADENTGVEQLIPLYEQGVKLVKECEQRLQQVEVKLTMYSKDGEVEDV